MGSSLGTGPKSQYPRSVAWITRASWWALAALIGTSGCAADQGAETGSNDIIGGVRDDDAAAKSGVVALRIGDESAYEICSGAVLAPNVVLTARHCVAKNLTDSVACDENGQARGGDHVAGNDAPSSIAVFTGAVPSFRRDPAALAKTIISPEGPSLCDSDIALIVLDRPLTGMEPFAVRRSASARIGEKIRAVGYGRSDTRTPIGTRFRKERVPVLAVGKAVTESKTALGDHEFEVGKAICEGDSGGPAISEFTGAVIGVVSRGGPCGDDFGHVYTSTAGFDALFDRAFQSAGAGAKPILEKNTPPENLPPPPAATDDPPSKNNAASSGCSLAPRGGASAPTGYAAALLALAFALTRRKR